MVKQSSGSFTDSRAQLIASFFRSYSIFHSGDIIVIEHPQAEGCPRSSSRAAFQLGVLSYQDESAYSKEGGIPGGSVVYLIGQSLAALWPCWTGFGLPCCSTLAFEFVNSWIFFSVAFNVVRSVLCVVQVFRLAIIYNHPSSLFVLNQS